MANRLLHETSPYLLQHAHNPVDWYPWGPEALEKARAQDKPILLSIGYAACHWCHVMEHESFEDEATARIMNEHFVNIKVDREERPDLDSLYLASVQAMTGRGGWPMTVFLTPQGLPFYGGTYFPPEDRYGMPSFQRVLLGVAALYRSRHAEVEQSAQRIREFLEQQLSLAAPGTELNGALLEGAYRALSHQFDPIYGGFGHAPKFPQPMNLELLLRTHGRTGEADALAMLELTLKKMAQGGIYDQLGGGFHRYSVDAQWLVPHFEKMLYDNALLSHLYLLTYQATGNPFYRRIAEETLDYVLREMTDPLGGFYATQDADSEGREGKFFLWTPAEVRALLGEEEARLCNAYFDVTATGNFEGKNILHVPKDPAVVAQELGVSAEHLLTVIQRGRQVLFQAREQRVKPGRDEKVLTAWNGLMLRSYALAARILGRDDYRRTAETNAAFLLQNLRRDDRLQRTHRDGISKLNAYLEDYAFLADGLLALYEATFELPWLQEARSLIDTAITLFWDEGRGAFYDTSQDHERLIARPRDCFDNATPSGNSVAVDVLLRLAVLTGDDAYRNRAAGVLHSLAGLVAQHPGAFGRLLGALDFYLATPLEIVVAGDPEAADAQGLLEVVYQRYLPNKVVMLRPKTADPAAEAYPLLRDRQQLGGRATAYLCQHYTCQAPIATPEELAQQLAVAGTNPSGADAP